MNKEPVRHKQTDPRWSALPYQASGESATVGGSGCGPTCAAMLIETLTEQTFTPADACRWSVEHGYKAKGQGTYYSYFPAQFAAFGLECVQMNQYNLYKDPGNLIHEDMAALVRDGGYLIACMGRGLWTSAGHFVVVWWMDEETVYILDPASDRPERLRGDREVFCSQVKYYWWVNAEEHNQHQDFDQHGNCPFLPCGRDTKSPPSASFARGRADISTRGTTSVRRLFTKTSLSTTGASSV